MWSDYQLNPPYRNMQQIQSLDRNTLSINKNKCRQRGGVADGSGRTPIEGRRNYEERKK